MSHGILKTELSPKKQSWAGMRKECMSQPAGTGTVKMSGRVQRARRERDSGNQKIRQTVFHGSGQLLMPLKLTAKNLILSKILAL